MDKIIIKNLRLYAYHGVNPEEKSQGQPFFIDIEAFTDLKRASMTDDISDTVSYSKITKTVRKIFLERSWDLIEKAAGKIASGVLKEFPTLKAVTVRVKKPEAPVKADFEYMAVEINLSRDELYGVRE
ncbi:MAG TPA: dihydroneopterin aldolase [Clostridiales bacterium]|nr:dihydroneopterin aldolase [Clostridiales bacterium]HXK84070.1 dihydroneopterin aldolase [Clostridiales bacterium]